MQAIGLLSLAALSSGGAVFPVPDPYRWDESFTVEMPQIDDEHRGLFNAILKVERDNTEANLKEANIKYHDHFHYEQELFKQTMSAAYISDHLGKHAAFLERFDAWAAPVAESELTWAKNWLVQHIKNTDFKYVGLMPHHVPKPYNWDDSVEVFYSRLDEEHKILFDHIRELGHNPESTQHLANLKSKMRAHFDYESGLFCSSDSYEECEEHKLKHDVFFKRLYAFTNPTAQEDVDWAKNWLYQHIINTDFKYKSKLNNYEHVVPRPYIWNPTFSVFYEQLDDEHKALFDAIRDVVDHPEDADKYAHLTELMQAHFTYEQGEFMQIPDFEDWAMDHVAKHDHLMELLHSNSVPLDCDFINYVETWFVQHVMNTDFAYRGKLVHETPEPYIWDESFMTFYKRIDDEHKVLFDCIRESSEDPANNEKFSFCKTKLRMHFDYEEGEFCQATDYDCYGHYLKHYKFQTKFQEASVPLPADVTTWAKNWLAQHIKNTDFAYRGKLFLRRHYVVPEPYVWDESFLVDVKQLDNEHVALFDIMREVEANRDSQAVWDGAVELYNEHFRYEESLFSTIQDGAHDIADHRLRHLGVMNTLKGAVVPITVDMTEFIKNWLAQHIKNTDFSYKGKMPKQHPIPEPFKWNSFFAVYYQDMDEDHKVLFSCLAEVEANPSDDALLASCLTSYEEHFKKETDLLADSGTYPKEELYQHINKHNTFTTAMRGLSTPVSQEWIDFAKNWLSQHIPNTDFRYKGMMPFPVADPYVWDESYEVFHTRLDEEHVVLFNIMQALKDDPSNVDLLNNNRDIFRDHFDYEEKQFLACGEPCDADAHKKKHDIFFKTLTWVTNPVSTEYMDWAMNWLAQHIKNTDFKYRYKLATQHKTPEPYIWNNEFEVYYPQLDAEHVGLFEIMYDVEHNLDDQDKVDALQELMRDHFFYEETQFCDSLDLPWDYCKEHKDKHVKFSERFAKMHAPVDLGEIKWAQDWLAQHIKNTDFGYKGHLKHEVPEPYVWDESFATDYTRLDSEHDVLFANILDVSQHPEDAAKLQLLKDNMDLHFQYEQQRYCAIPNYNCVDHKIKHYKFWVVLEHQQVPVGCEEINWAKNWLAQHIKNTDHQYRKRMDGPDSGDNFTGALP